MCFKEADKGLPRRGRVLVRVLGKQHPSISSMNNLALEAEAPILIRMDHFWGMYH